MLDGSSGEAPKTDREKAAARLKKLLNMTTANGASEEEAMAATMAARKIMDDWQLTQTEAELMEDGFDGQNSGRQNDPESFMIQMEMWDGIARFTETKVWVSTIRRRENKPTQDDLFGRKSAAQPTEKSWKTLHFFGLKSDVFFAVWLIQTLEGFVKRGALQYLTDTAGIVQRSKTKASSFDHDNMLLALSQPPGGRKTAETIAHKRLSFVAGAAKRINERLIEEAMKRARNRGTGTGLIVSKPGLIAAEMTRRGIVLGGRSNHSGMRAADSNAYRAGTDAGNRANFNRPVGERAGGPLNLTHKG